MRRSFVSVGLALLVGVSSVQAQSQQASAAPAASQQAPAAAPAQAPPDPLRFTTEEAAVIIQVAPGKSADFEAGFSKVLAALASSEKPEMKAFGATITLRKANTGAPADGPSLYLMLVNGASKELSYNWGKIIYYSGKDPSAEPAMIFPKREDADAIYKQINDAILTANNAQQVSVLPLSKIGG